MPTATAVQPDALLSQHLDNASSKEAELIALLDDETTLNFVQKLFILLEHTYNCNILADVVFTAALRDYGVKPRKLLGSTNVVKRESEWGSGWGPWVSNTLDWITFGTDIAKHGVENVAWKVRPLPLINEILKKLTSKHGKMLNAAFNAVISDDITLVDIASQGNLENISKIVENKRLGVENRLGILINQLLTHNPNISWNNVTPNHKVIIQAYINAIINNDQKLIGILSGHADRNLVMMHMFAQNINLSSPANELNNIFTSLKLLSLVPHISDSLAESFFSKIKQNYNDILIKQKVQEFATKIGKINAFQRAFTTTHTNTNAPEPIPAQATTPPVIPTPESLQTQELAQKLLSGEIAIILEDHIKLCNDALLPKFLDAFKVKLLTLQDNEPELLKTFNNVNFLRLNVNILQDRNYLLDPANRKIVKAIFNNQLAKNDFKTIAEYLDDDRFISLFAEILTKDNLSKILNHVNSDRIQSLFTNKQFLNACKDITLSSDIINIISSLFHQMKTEHLEDQMIFLESLHPEVRKPLYSQLDNFGEFIKEAKEEIKIELIDELISKGYLYQFSKSEIISAKKLYEKYFTSKNFENIYKLLNQSNFLLFFIKDKEFITKLYDLCQSNFHSSASVKIVEFLNNAEIPKDIKAQIEEDCLNKVKASSSAISICSKIDPYVEGKLLYEYFNDATKRNNFEALRDNIRDLSILAVGVVSDLQKNNESNHSSSKFYLEIAPHIHKKRTWTEYFGSILYKRDVFIAKILIEASRDEKSYELFTKLYRQYHTHLSVQDIEKIIINLHKNCNVTFSHILIEQYTTELSEETVAEIICLELQYETPNIQIIEKLLPRISNKLSPEIAGKALFYILKNDTLANKKLHKNLVSDQAIEFMFRNAVKHNTDVSQMIKHISNKPLIAAIYLLYTRENLSNFKNFIATEEDIIKVFEHSITLLRSKNISDPDILRSSLLKVLHLFDTVFDKKVIEPTYLNKILEATKKSFDINIVTTIAGTVFEQLDNYHKVAGYTLSDNTSKQLFGSSMYYMAKQNSPEVLGKLWPKSNPSYGIYYEVCDYRTYLAVLHSIKNKDQQTFQNICSIFGNLDSEAVKLLKGILSYSLKESITQHNDDLEKIISAIGKYVQEYSQPTYAWDRIFEFLDHTDFKEEHFDDKKISLLNAFFQNPNIDDESKSAIFKKGLKSAILQEDPAIKTRIIQIYLKAASAANIKLTECRFAYPVFNEILVGQDLDVNQAIFQEIRNTLDENIFPFIAQHTRHKFHVDIISEQLQDIPAKLFAHCLHYAKNNEVPLLITQYFKHKENKYNTSNARRTDDQNDIATTLINLKSHSKLSFFLKSEKPQLDLDKHAILLIDAIKTNDLGILDIVSNFIREKCRFSKHRTSIWDMLIYLVRMITFTSPTHEEEIGRKLFELCQTGADHEGSLRTLFHSNRLPTDNIEKNLGQLKSFDQISALGVASYALSYAFSKNNDTAIRIFSKSFADIVYHNPSYNTTTAFRKIGYNNLMQLLKYYKDVDKEFKGLAVTFLEEEYKQMDWASRILFQRYKTEHEQGATTTRTA